MYVVTYIPTEKLLDWFLSKFQTVLIDIRKVYRVVWTMFKIYESTSGKLSISIKLVHKV